MLRDLTINNYRSFQNFYVNGLAQVNLMVGSNNSGKTSLLEAVYLLVNQNHPRCLTDLLDNRGETILKDPALLTSGKLNPRSYQIRHIFPEHRINFDNVIEIQSTKDIPLSLHIQLLPISLLQPERLEDITETDIPELELNFTYQKHQPIKVPILDDGSVEPRFFKFVNSRFALGSITQRCQFLTTVNVTFSSLAKMWDEITLTPKEDEVVRGLQIIEPDVERISFTSRQTSNSGIIIKVRGQHDPIPLGSMGDGMRRILNLAIFAVNAENGFLLVDEIDTGLYYEVQADMWRLILEIAKRLNIQIFATTHSWDCVRAFEEALDDVEDSNIGKLFRLDMKYGKLRAVEYVAEDLKIAIQQDIEVR